MKSREQSESRLRLPESSRGEMLGVVKQLLGSNHAMVQCQDGKLRLSRISGRIYKKLWIAEGDLVIVVPWEFQDSKADLVYKYTSTEAIKIRSLMESRKQASPSHSWE